MTLEPSGTNDPYFTWPYAGTRYRLSVVGGLMRLEQEIRAGCWYLVEPNHDTTAVLVCAELMAEKLRVAEELVARLRAKLVAE